jgi:DNA repair exonuclease SbcCD nuclease subunit
VIPLSDLDGDFRAGFFGHYHHPQILKADDQQIVYGGSVNVNEHGEDHRKTWTEWTPEGTRFHRINTPARVTLIVDDLGKTVEVKPADADLDGLGEADHLKVRVIAQGDRMDQAITTGRRVRAKYAEGIRSVTVEYDTQVQHRTREGAEDVAARSAIPDKVALYLDRKRPKIKGTLKAEALQILDELLEEVGATRWG